MNNQLYIISENSFLNTLKNNFIEIIKLARYIDDLVVKIFEKNETEYNEFLNMFFQFLQGCTFNKELSFMEQIDPSTWYNIKYSEFINNEYVNKNILMCTIKLHGLEQMFNSTTDFLSIYNLQNH